MKLPESVVLNNKNLKILTPNGYEHFYGVNKIERSEYMHLTFSNDEELKCSLDHPIVTIDGIIKAKYLKKTTEVITKTGGCFLVTKKHIKKKIELYDIVNSGKDHIYYGNNILSHNCEFLGSVDTLISGAKLATLVQQRPKTSNAGLDVYEDPIEDRQYVITVDVARGVEIDYSAFVVFDITEFPYKVVAKYRKNDIKPMMFPYIIRESARAYNNAYLLCEVNDVGDQVASILQYELEYPNVLMCSQKGRAGQVVGHGFSGKKTQLGVKMSRAVKKVGCLNLKTIIEDEKLIFNDYDIISELTTFVQKSGSFEAEEGCNDDLAMCIHRTGKITTEDGIKTIKWIVDNQYKGKVLSIDSDRNFVWSRVIGHSEKKFVGSNKKWIQLRGNSKNTLTCTSDHKVAFIKDIFNPTVSYIEADQMLDKYNVALPGQRFHKTNPLYNKNQISMIIGSLIGDSSISKTGKLITAHSEKQREYAEHKHLFFKGNIRVVPSNEKRTASYYVDALTNGQTHELRNLFYLNGKKTVCNIINYIDEISLAYWYMDDGHLHSNSAILCTDSFSYEDNCLLQYTLKNKFNISSKVTKNIDCRSKKEYYRIFIGKESRDIFFELISPYVIESMEYKIPTQYRGKQKKELDSNCLNFGAEKISKIKDLKSKGQESKLYDITVEGTHNFICNGMVVHNCLVIFAWLICQDYFKELTDNDIRKRLYDEKQEQLEQDMAPFGFFSDGITNESTFVDNDGTLWKADEYGDMSYMWQYNF